MKKMMRFFCLVFFAFFAIPLCFACDSHEHALEKGFKYDESYHWTSCKGCDEKFNLESHQLVSLSSRAVDADYGTVEQDFEGGKTYCFLFKATGTGEAKIWFDNGITLNHQNKFKSLKFVDKSNIEFLTIYDEDYCSYKTNSGLTIGQDYFVFVTIKDNENLNSYRLYIENYDNVYASRAKDYNNTLSLTVNASDDLYVYKYSFDGLSEYKYNLSIEGQIGNPLETSDVFSLIQIVHGKNCEKISLDKYANGMYKTFGKPFQSSESYFIIFKFNSQTLNKNVKIVINR